MQQENKQLISYDQIPNSPFTLVCKDNNYFASLGNYRLSPNFPDKESVKHYLAENIFNVMLDMLSVAITYLDDKSIQTEK